MVSQTNEQALESLIERKLTGVSLEDLRAGENWQQVGLVRLCTISQLAEGHHGFEVGLPASFNKQFAIDESFFWQFLENTQSDELDKLRKTGGDWQRKILERFDRLVKKDGLLKLLKNGLRVDNAHLTLMYPAPLANSADKIRDNYAANIFSVTRQLQYSITNPLQEVDMVLFLNGMPLVTMELKNPWTGQNAAFHGQKQYREDRDTKQALFQFARALVHMAVDTDEVYMTTKLAGKNTFFLPFNKGNNGGKGNPVNPGGHRSAYLWDEIFAKDSLVNIIQHFMRLDGKSTDALDKRTLFFPRYHQLDVVRRLVKDVSAKGVGQTYLIQHSAGSGKSNSITWAAYQLIEAYPESDGLPGARGVDHPLFDSVIVVTDRKILDRQLRDNIRQFSEVGNIIAPAFKSSELKSALEQGKKIIITTIQKFPFIVDGIADLSDKRFAVIVDEAHSSQSGVAADNMNKAMGGNADIDADDPGEIQDQIVAAMKARKMRGNASYFAFTATPKNTTLEKFGTPGHDGEFLPFHLYSMKQAIEEGFILDVLANYTTYKSYYEIRKSVEDNPEFDSAQAQKRLKAFVEKNPATIKVKAEIMLDHFIDNVISTKKLRGKGRGMIVTQSIESAIRYYQAITRLLEARGTPFKAIIAFSGEKKIDGVPYTEADMNGFPDDKTKEYFDGVDKDGKPIVFRGEKIENTYRLLIVANKYLTGFDQPKLCSMYVDKKLAGVLAVQALSRLNRSAPKLGKRTQDLFVLDFFNSVDDIKHAFDDFYTSTSLSGATDVNVLHELKDHLDDVGVYEWLEAKEFTERYFQGVDADGLSPFIDMAVNRFDHELKLEDSDKIDFKVKAKQFVKVYGQLAAILPFELVEWELLYWFLKFLVPKLKVQDGGGDEFDKILEAVDLSSYGLSRERLGHSIKLDDEGTILDPQNPNPRGNHDPEKEMDPLDQIIEIFNDRWFQGWSATPEEQRVKFLNLAASIRAHPDFAEKYQNNKDSQNRELAFQKIFDDVMMKNRANELELYKLLATDDAFKAALQDSLKQMVE